MRTYGRITNPLTGVKTWVVVETDANGYNDNVYITTLCQVLKLNLGESPFYANYGIPARNSVLSQTQPDQYVSRTQQQFAQYFASLVVAKIDDNPPTYNIALVTQNGSILNATIAT